MNSTLTTDGRHLVALFGSEGLYCFDLDGTRLWNKDLGELDSSFFAVPGAQWESASSPVIASEDGDVFVVKAGPAFELTATNPMGEVCMASPARSKGVIYFRSQSHVVAVADAR